MDHWGLEWEYGRSVCENNARLECVSNVRFVDGSASKLPFGDASVDVVMSCLSFHEVRDTLEKEKSVAEALRVLKQGGRFVFLDLFDDPKFYPDPGKLGDTIARAGASVTENKPLRDLLPLPFPLNIGRSLKFARIVAGIKAGSTAQRP